MKLFFWGFLLIFLDFSLTINGVGFDLLPDAIGYLLVFLGARQMAEESEQFARMRPIALVLMIVGFVSLLLSPFGPIELTPGWPVILAATTVPLLLLLLEKNFAFTGPKTGRILAVYHAGLNLTAVMFLVRGVLQVLGAPLSAGASAAISGVAGIGHILLGVSLVLVLLQLRRAVADRS